MSRVKAHFAHVAALLSAWSIATGCTVQAERPNVSRVSDKEQGAFAGATGSIRGQNSQYPY